MAEGWGFCPYCRTPRAAPDAAICSGCGRQLPALAGTVPLPPPIPAPRIRRSVLSSWTELNTIMGIVGYTFLAWIVLSLAVGLTFGQAVAHDVGVEFGALNLANADLTVIGTQLAMFSSLVAGLNFRTFGGGAASTLAVVPIGSLAVLALVARFSARRALRRYPPASIADLFIRITIAAALAALAIYVVANLAILLYAATIAPPAGPLTTSAGTASAADPDGLLFVLFPALWIGAAAGVFSLAPARALVGRAFWARVGNRVGELVRFLTPAWVAVRAYLQALVGLSIVVVAGWAVFVVVNAHADTTGVVFALPSVLAMGPNAALGLAVGATGSGVHLGSADGSLWQSDPWMIAAGILSLVGPALYAGLAVGRRHPNSTPGEIGAAGVVVGLVGLALVNVAAPSLKQAVVTSLPTGGGAVTRMTFDLGQAVLVGGAVVIAAVVVGFIAGVVTRPAQASAQHPAAVPTITV